MWFKSGLSNPFGKFTYTGPSGTYPCLMRIRNTQFHSLYFGRFQAGYEPEVCAVLDLLIKEDSVLIDVGANWGFFCGYVATKPNFKGKIIAFEPQESVFNDLKHFICTAHLEDRVSILQIALSNQQAKGQMRLPDKVHSGLATLYLAQDGNIPIKTLDDFNLPASVIKIDAEGHELAVIEGSSKTIDLYQPAILFESLPDEHTKLVEILTLLDTKKYVCFALNVMNMTTNQREQARQVKVTFIPLSINSSMTKKTNILALPIAQMSKLEQILKETK